MFHFLGKITEKNVIFHLVYEILNVMMRLVSFDLKDPWPNRKCQNKTNVISQNFTILFWIFLEQDLTQFSRFTKNIIVRFEFKMSLTAHFLQSEWLVLTSNEGSIQVETLTSKISYTIVEIETEALTKSFYWKLFISKTFIIIAFVGILMIYFWQILGKVKK